jgi:hypothetical protein
MPSVLLSDSLSGKRRDRKARKLARLLVALDNAANERHSSLPRRSRMSLSTTR